MTTPKVTSGKKGLHNNIPRPSGGGGQDFDEGTLPFVCINSLSSSSSRGTFGGQGGRITVPPLRSHEAPGRVHTGERGREGERGGRGGRKSKDDTDAAGDGDPGGAVLEGVPRNGGPVSALPGEGGFTPTSRATPGRRRGGTGAEGRGRGRRTPRGSGGSSARARSPQSPPT